MFKLIAFVKYLKLSATQSTKSNVPERDQNTVMSYNNSKSHTLHFFLITKMWLNE